MMNSTQTVKFPKCPCGCGERTSLRRYTTPHGKAGLPLYLKNHSPHEKARNDPKYKLKYLGKTVQTPIYLTPDDRKKMDKLCARLEIKGLSALVRELVRSAVEGMR